MFGLAILFGFNLVGVLLQKGLHIPIPGNVIGLVLLLIALACKWIKIEWVESTAMLLTKNMMLFFLPILVGASTLLPVIQTEWVSVVLSLLLGTGLVIVVTGLTAQSLLKRGGGANESDRSHT